ncbi:MAG: DUF5615 family PIN-like protein [Pyrinomonadaceae bacterium]
MVSLLNDHGHDAVHTRDLPAGNATKDHEINRISIAELRVVVSKDGDFYNSFAAKNEPHKLLHIATGNITNKQLLALITINLDLIIRSLESGAVVSVDNNYVVVIH